MVASLMATPKKQPAGSEDRSGRKTAPIQVPKDLARMVATIAAHDQISQAEVIQPLIEQAVRTQYERVQREIAERVRRMKHEG